MRHLSLLFAAFAVAATGGAMAAKDPKPTKEQVKFEEAQKLTEAKQYVEANKIFDELCKKRIEAGCQSRKYNDGLILFDAKKFGEAAAVFDKLCTEKITVACDNAKIAHGNQAIIDKQTPADLEKQRRQDAFEAALAQYKAKQYDQAYAGFSALCTEGLDSGCQNQAAVLVEQSDSILKAAKRPNGEDCSTAVIASDFCRKPMADAVAVLGKICPTQNTNAAMVQACAKRASLERYIAETDKQIGGGN